MKWLPKTRIPQVPRCWVPIRIEHPMEPAEHRRKKRWRYGVRMFDGESGKWWAPTSEGLVANDIFDDWLYIPSVTERQGA